MLAFWFFTLKLGPKKEIIFSVNGSSVDQINGSMLNIKNFTPRKIEHDGSNSVKIDDVSLWKTLFTYGQMRELYGLHRSSDISRAESKKL